LYNESRISSKKDVRGDQYPTLPFRESPVGERGLELDGEIPSASFIQLRTSLLEGQQNAVKEPDRPLPRTNKTEIFR